MAFSLDIKKELSQIKNLANKEEVRYELLGYFFSNNISIDDEKIKYSTENEYNIDRFSKLLRNVNLQDYEIGVQGKIYYIKMNVKKMVNLILI